MKDPCVYILASAPNATLYIGVTSDLHGRMDEHTKGLFEGFSKKYRVKSLVYYEMHDTMDAAILRETRLKRWNRLWKIRLIEQMNPEWTNLYDPDTGAVEPGPVDTERLSQEPIAGMSGFPPSRE